jgi:hypothetical protein
LLGLLIANFLQPKDYQDITMTYELIERALVSAAIVEADGHEHTCKALREFARDLSAQLALDFRVSIDESAATQLTQNMAIE